MILAGKEMLRFSSPGCILAVALFSVTVSQPRAARAALTQSEIAQVAADPGPNASLPPHVSLTDERGATKSLQQWLNGKPTIWVLADYTCKTLCGPVIGEVADALDKSGLRPGADYRYMVMGLDPKDTAADAAAMKEGRIGGALAKSTFFLRASPDNTAALLRTFGFQTVYDRENDQFAHPAAAFVVTPQGRIANVLSGLGLQPTDVRLALVSASQGRVGSFADHIRLLCYGFDPTRGVYNVAIGRVLAGAGAVTAISLILLIAALFRADRLSRS
jgi:protein SCO1/2